MTIALDRQAARGHRDDGDGIRLGNHLIDGRAFVAPMAGVTDRPYRQLCKRLGARYAVGEMAASNPALWASVKTARRIDHAGEPEPKVVQIAGADPAMMAEAARFNVERGAQIIDINMGCPAKKVCNRASGSALMADEDLAIRIIGAVVEAVSVPVTVKMRTGTDRTHENAPRLARAAERAGAAMITVHGRSRACGFGGSVDLDAIARVRDAISVPLVANGDIDSPQRAREVLDRTGAAAVMIGRAAQGRPWLFAQVDQYLRTGELGRDPSPAQVGTWLRQHLADHYRFHGEWTGARTARKHIGWTLRSLSAPDSLRAAINRCDEPEEQLRLLAEFFDDVRDAVASDMQPYQTEASAQ
jgi:tRNA-dihydrouridine synthase B